MDNDRKNKKIKTAPAIKNDQLGENASEEFSKDYDNKGNTLGSNDKKRCK